MNFTKKGLGLGKIYNSQVFACMEVYVKQSMRFQCELVILYHEILEGSTSCTLQNYKIGGFAQSFLCSHCLLGRVSWFVRAVL